MCLLLGLLLINNSIKIQKDKLSYIIKFFKSN